MPENVKRLAVKYAALFSAGPDWVPNEGEIAAMEFLEDWDKCPDAVYPWVP